jgi:hypothetical protein
MDFDTLRSRLDASERLKEHEIGWLSEYVGHRLTMGLWEDVMEALLDSGHFQGARRFHDAVAPQVRNLLGAGAPPPPDIS